MKLNPNNPYHDPIIQPNYFEHPQDIIDLREAVKIARKIFAQDALEHFRGPEIAPGNVTNNFEREIALYFASFLKYFDLNH